MLLLWWGADAQLLLVNIGERSFLAAYFSGFVLSRGRWGCKCGDVVFAGSLLDPLLTQLLCLTWVGNNPSTIRPASNKVVAQATGQEPGSRTQRRCAHNNNGQAKERNRGSKPLSKNVNPRSQSNNERPRPNKAIAWSKQGNKATISTAVP